MPEYARRWFVGNARAIIPQALEAGAAEGGCPTPWAGLANSIDLPIGENYGKAVFLIQESLGREIMEKKLPISISVAEFQKQGDRFIPTRTVTWNDYIPAKCYKAGKHVDAKNGACAIELYDKRFALQNTATNRRFNLQGESDWIEDTLSAPATPYTWQQVLAAIWSDLPAIAGASPAIPYTPGSTPENLIFEGVSAWKSVIAVLHAVGCELVFDPFENEFSAVRMTTDQPAIQSARSTAVSEKRLIWDWAPNPCFNYPESVAAVFPAQPSDTSQSPFAAPATAVPLSINALSQVGGTYPILDTMFATGSNSAALAARAVEIGNAVKGLYRPLWDPEGFVVSGVEKLIPGSECNRIIWSYDGEGSRTEILNTFQGVPAGWPGFDSNSPGGSSSPSTPFTMAFFTLDEDLPYVDAPSASATVTKANGEVTVGATITVLGSGKYRAKEGCSGVAIKDAEGNYWIVEIQQPALFLAGTLGDSPGDSEADPHYGAKWNKANAKIVDGLSMTPYPFNWAPSSVTTATHPNPYRLNGQIDDDAMWQYDQVEDEYKLIAVYPKSGKVIGFNWTGTFPLTGYANSQTADCNLVCFRPCISGRDNGT